MADWERRTKTCDCGEEVVFVRPRRKDGSLGKWHPLTVASKERRFVLHEDGTATQALTMRTHFADCPNAESYRGDKDE